MKTPHRTPAPRRIGALALPLALGLAGALTVSGALSAAAGEDATPPSPPAAPAAAAEAPRVAALPAPIAVPAAVPSGAPTTSAPDLAARAVVLPDADVVSQQVLSDEGIRVEGDGFPAGSVATISIPGFAETTEDVDDDGWVSANIAGRVPAGEHVIRIVADGTAAEAPLTVTAGGFDTSLDISHPEGLAQWDLARSGTAVTGDGYPANAPLTLTVDGTAVDEVISDAWGRAELALVQDLAVGEHEVALASTEVVATSTASLHVLADGDVYPGPFEGTISASPWVVTAQELAEEPIRVRAEDLPGGSSADYYLDGRLVSTEEIAPLGTVVLDVAGPVELGEHRVRIVHASGSLQADFHVVPEGQGDRPAAGTYGGDARQTHVGGVRLDEPDVDERPFAMTIDGAGRVTGLSGEFRWICVTPDGQVGSGTVDVADEAPIPATPLTTARPFEIEWAGSAAGFDFTFAGIVEADGSASGRLIAGLGSCGSSVLEWNLQGDAGPRPTPTPTPTNPQPTPSPSTPNPTPTPSVPNPGATDYPAPAPEALTEATEGGISTAAFAREGQRLTVTFDAARAGQSAGLWLLSDPSSLGVRAIAADGTVQVTLPEGVTGAHRLAAVEADGTVIGWQDIVISAEQGSAPPLAATGGEVPLLLIGLAGVGVLVGLVLLRVRRRDA
ncbi:hypothetical protein PFZ55_50700 [Streptomyces sp. MS2A]|nr:hypothetical protein [Streptomyces sp. MS2A]